MEFVSKAAAATRKPKWPWENESPLLTQLLGDRRHEIELSGYERLPASGYQSPTVLMHSEGFRRGPIRDLDIFFERVYEYYRQKGLQCIVIKWITEILTISFLLFFIGFFMLYVDWNAIRHIKCGVDALESGEKPCDLGGIIKQNPLVPFTFTTLIIVGLMVILTACGLSNFLKFFVQFKSTMKARNFYYKSLNVTDREIQMAQWPSIMQKVVQLQKSQQLCVVRDLSEHDIIMRIMRKENYLIAMVNKGILAFPIPWWIPGAGSPANSRVNRRKCYTMLPKTLEWTLDWCILQNMFDSKFCVQKDFISSPELLKKRLVFTGIGMLLLSPRLAIFLLVYFFISYAEQFYNEPNTVSSRRWSNVSRWTLREFNEVDHLWKKRMNSTVVYVENYLDQFPSPLISIIAKFISFVFGGLTGILLLLGFFGESALEGHVFRRNLLWYTIVFGGLATISRRAVATGPGTIDPEGTMSDVVKQTHYKPKRWHGNEDTEFVRKECANFFKYTVIVLLEEMASILITPYLLVFVIPKHVDDILQSISDFTVYVDGVGDVCSLSLFDFERHGNSKYGSPFDAAKNMRSSQGKMEKSFLSFQSMHPSWEPNAHGKLFLSNLQKFKEQQMSSETQRGCSSINVSGLSSSRDQTDDIFRNTRIHPASYDLGFLGLVSTEQRTCPYLLDWYYTSSPQHSGEEEDWNQDRHLSERVQSHLEASTSRGEPFGLGHFGGRRHGADQKRIDKTVSIGEPGHEEGSGWHDTRSNDNATVPFWARPRPDLTLRGMCTDDDAAVPFLARKLPEAYGRRFSATGHPEFGNVNLADHSISHDGDDVSEKGRKGQGLIDSSDDDDWSDRLSTAETTYLSASDREEVLSCRSTRTNISTAKPSGHQESFTEPFGVCLQNMHPVSKTMCMSDSDNREDFGLRGTRSDWPLARQASFTDRFGICHQATAPSMSKTMCMSDTDQEEDLGLQGTRSYQAGFTESSGVCCDQNLVDCSISHHVDDMLEKSMMEQDPVNVVKSLHCNSQWDPEELKRVFTQLFGGPLVTLPGKYK